MRWKKQKFGTTIFCIALSVLMTGSVSSVYGAELQDGGGQSETVQDLILEAEQTAENSEADYDGFIVQLSDSGREKIQKTDPDMIAEEGLPGDDLLTIGRLKDLPEELDAEDIEQIEPDYILELMEDSTETAVNDPDYLNGKQDYLNIVNVPEVWELGLEGETAGEEEPVKVAVIDSGINTAHEDFDADSFDLEHARNFIDGESTDISDTVGHGTMVASEIVSIKNNGIGTAGIMPKVVVVPIKVTDGKEISMASLLESLDYAIELNVDVINLSLGGEGVESDLLKTACQTVVDQGILMIASAGNAGTSTAVYPAAYDCVIGVGSVGTSSSKTEVSTFSERGTDNVFCVAPGYAIRGASYSSSSSYATRNGTSFSGPIVSAYAAMVRSLDRSIDQDDLKDLIIRTSQDLGTEGRDEDYGYGLVDFLAAAEECMLDQSFDASEDVSDYAGSCSLVRCTAELPEGWSVFYQGSALYYSAKKSCWLWVTDGEESEVVSRDGFTIEKLSDQEERLQVTGDGDVNGNGRMNIIDSQIAYDLSKGSYSGFDKAGRSFWLEADVNGDNMITSADARAIQYWIHNQ